MTGDELAEMYVIEIKIVRSFLWGMGRKKGEILIGAIFCNQLKINKI